MICRRCLTLFSKSDKVSAARGGASVHKDRRTCEKNLAPYRTLYRSDFIISDAECVSRKKGRR